MRPIFSLLLLVFTSLLGCAMIEYVSEEKPVGNQLTGSTAQANYARNCGLTNFWMGRNVEKLVAVLGEPDLVINTAPMGAKFTNVAQMVCYVYMPKPGSRNHCSDAYVVDLKSGIIICYHCR